MGETAIAPGTVQHDKCWGHCRPRVLCEPSWKLSGGGDPRVESSGMNQCVGRQRVVGRPWGLWHVVVGLAVVGNKAGGRMRLGVPGTHRVTNRPVCLGLKGILIPGTWRAKPEKVLGNQ